MFVLNTHTDNYFKEVSACLNTENVGVSIRAFTANGQEKISIHLTDGQHGTRTKLVGTYTVLEG